MSTPKCDKELRSYRFWWSAAVVLNIVWVLWIGYSAYLYSVSWASQLCYLIMATPAVWALLDLWKLRLR